MTSATNRFTDTEINIIMDEIAAGRAIRQAGVMTSLVNGEQTLSLLFADGTYLGRPLASCDRQRIEALVDTLIDLVDRMDGDENIEFDAADDGIADENGLTEQYSRSGFMAAVV